MGETVVIYAARISHCSKNAAYQHKSEAIFEIFNYI
jgi:hypothetical protein